MVKTKLLQPLLNDLSFKIYYSHRRLNQRTLLALQRWHQAQTVGHFKSINESPLQYWCRRVMQIRILKINTKRVFINKTEDDFEDTLSILKNLQENDPISIGAPLNLHSNLFFYIF